MSRALYILSRYCLAPRTRSFRASTDVIENSLPYYKNVSKVFKNKATTETSTATRASTAAKVAKCQEKHLPSSHSVHFKHNTNSTAKSSSFSSLLASSALRYVLPERRATTGLLDIPAQSFQVILAKYEKMKEIPVINWICLNGSGLAFYQLLIAAFCTAVSGWQFWNGRWTHQSVLTSLESYHLSQLHFIQFREGEKRFTERVHVLGNISLNPAKLNALMDGYAVTDGFLWMQIVFVLSTYPLIKHFRASPLLRKVLEINVSKQTKKVRSM